MNIDWIELNQVIIGGAVGWIFGLISGVMLAHLNDKLARKREIEKLKAQLSILGISRFGQDWNQLCVLRVTNTGSQPVTIVDAGIITENRQSIEILHKYKSSLPALIRPGEIHEIEIDEKELVERICNLNDATFGQTGAILGFYVVDAQDGYYGGSISTSTPFEPNLRIIEYLGSKFLYRQSKSVH